MCFSKLCNFFFQIAQKNASYLEDIQNRHNRNNNNKKLENLEEQEGNSATTTSNETNLSVNETNLAINETNLAINWNQTDSQINAEDILEKNDSDSDKNKDKQNEDNVNDNNNNSNDENNAMIDLDRPSLLRVSTEHEWSNEMLNNYEAELKNAILNAQNSLRNEDIDFSISNIPDVANSDVAVPTTSNKGENDHENENLNVNVDVNTNNNQDTDSPIETEQTHHRSSLLRATDEQWNESELNDYENELREQMKYLAYLTASEKQRDGNSNIINNNDNENMTAITSSPSSRSRCERDGDDITKMYPQDIDLQKMKETISMENENEIRKQIEFLRQQLKSNNEGNTPGGDIKRDNYSYQYYYYYYYHYYHYQQQQERQQEQQPEQQQEQQQEQRDQQINIEQESRC